MQQQDANPLKILEGVPLNSVEFVADYVQLHFVGPSLTAITCPIVQVMNERFEWGQPGYRDALCGRIAKLVRRAFTVDDQEIRIVFDDGSSITISLKQEDFRGPEAAIFDRPSHSGEPP